MYEHALAILEDTKSWQWPCILASSNKSTIKVNTSSLLYHLIEESHNLGGAVLEEFWTQFGQCGSPLADNSERIYCPVFFFWLGSDYLFLQS
jgi:hypothetical protein